ncbi:trimeric intracellular cation channel family protein [Alkalimarinus alittae]|uniref:Trimeric intracellular cation channel family protein n=1 Tax=Alkalimarinus alittae TaxID=2961619 RepID=A0ABY6N2H2_9ALTE|nr:trimeric intracellular cation channel family protein [Alkalimarinus alittae]UZE96298.1 trimeric intracellular cation channel family protein [Alkalimarinus alittae]
MINFAGENWAALFIDSASTFGLVVFAISGALAAGRYKMDPVGFVVLGAVTAIGGGTMRSLLLDEPVSWVVDPNLLLFVVLVSLLTYFFIPGRTARWKAMTWFDALGLAAFSVTGAQATLSAGAGWQIAIAMGVVTATGGGVIRDVLCNQQPFVLRGELYASTALAGAGIFVSLVALAFTTPTAMICGFVTTLVLRGSAIIYGIELGEPGEWFHTTKKRAAKTASAKNDNQT